MDGKRSFTVIEVSTASGHIKGRENLGGIFRSKTPISAAKKAGTKICAMSKIHGQCTLFITIKETTRGSLGNEYIYRVKRIRNDRVVMRGDREIVYRYKIVAHSLKPEDVKADWRTMVQMPSFESEPN